MVDRKKIGPHEVSFEAETGFISFVHVGMIEEPHARELAASFLAYANGAPIYVIADSRRATGATREARRAATNDGAGWGDIPFFMAIFGAPLVVRTIANLVFKAMAVTTFSRATIISVATEQEARAWLADHQRALLTRRGARAS